MKAAPECADGGGYFFTDADDDSYCCTIGRDALYVLDSDKAF